MTDPTTRLVQAGIGWDPAFGAVIPPLTLSTTYVWREPDVAAKGPFDYGRTNNPNRDLLAATLAELDGGAGAVVTGSGMAAIDLVLNLLPAGARVVAPHDCYGGTYRLLDARHRQEKIDAVFVDQTDGDALKAALDRPTALLWLETPSNPLMRITDIRAACERARAAGALTCVDNTFLTPLRQRPLDLGADLAVQSTTKYLNGHSDVVGGVVVAKAAERAEELAWWANAAGLTGAPFDAYQTLRGLRTLGLRVDAAERNAQALVTMLREHRAVREVFYADGDDARLQQSGPGAMLSFRLGSAQVAARFFEALPLIPLAASLGGTESLICQPATMTHRGMSEAARAAAGLDETLVRLSVGIEARDDLIAALEAGLASL